MYSNNSSDSYRKGLDWVTVILYMILVIFGWLNLYAANYNPEVGPQFTFSSEYFKQLVWIVVSLLCAGAIMLSDSKLFVEMAWPFYGFSIFLLVLVLFIGKEVYGAKSWIALGPIAFQPGEFAKIGTALVLSRIMSRYEFSFKYFSSYAQLFGVILVPVLLILLQNDTGSALVYFVFLLAMFREGLSPHILLVGVSCLIAAICALLLTDFYTIIGIVCISIIASHFVLFGKGLPTGGLKTLLVCGAAVALAWAIPTFILHKPLMPELVVLIGAAAMSVYLLLAMLIKRIKGVLWLLAYMWIALSTAFAFGYIFENVLGAHQRTRINVLFGIEDDPLGAGYNVNQSLIAIGSGGALGKGFLNGTQTKLDFVPKQTTDFIFCTVGEEWGFVGSTALVAIYIFFFLRIMYLAEKQHSTFSRVYGYCVAGVFFFHFTINICMTIGLMPVIGIPLPFFSYGGTSLWGFSMMLWMFLKLDTDRNFLIR